VVVSSPLAVRASPHDSTPVGSPAYPDYTCRLLANAHRFHEGLATILVTPPVHGECGGYMCWRMPLMTATGARQAWLACLTCDQLSRAQCHLRYRERGFFSRTARQDGPAYYTGHAFHYVYAGLACADERGLEAQGDAQGQTARSHLPAGAPCPADVFSMQSRADLICLILRMNRGPNSLYPPVKP